MNSRATRSSTLQTSVHKLVTNVQIRSDEYVDVGGGRVELRADCEWVGGRGVGLCVGEDTTHCSLQLVRDDRVPVADSLRSAPVASAAGAGVRESLGSSAVLACHRQRPDERSRAVAIVVRVARRREALALLTRPAQSREAVRSCS